MNRTVDTTIFSRIYQLSYLAMGASLKLVTGDLATSANPSAFTRSPARSQFHDHNVSPHGAITGSTRGAAGGEITRRGHEHHHGHHRGEGQRIGAADAEEQRPRYRVSVTAPAPTPMPASAQPRPSPTTRRTIVDVLAPSAMRIPIWRVRPRRYAITPHNRS